MPFSELVSVLRSDLTQYRKDLEQAKRETRQAVEEINRIATVGIRTSISGGRSGGGRSRLSEAEAEAKQFENQAKGVRQLNQAQQTLDRSQQQRTERAARETAQQSTRQAQDARQLNQALNSMDRDREQKALRAGQRQQQEQKQINAVLEQRSRGQERRAQQAVNQQNRASEQAKKERRQVNDALQSIERDRERREKQAEREEKASQQRRLRENEQFTKEYAARIRRGYQERIQAERDGLRQLASTQQNALRGRIETRGTSPDLVSRANTRISQAAQAGAISGNFLEAGRQINAIVRGVERADTITGRLGKRFDEFGQHSLKTVTEQATQLAQVLGAIVVGGVIGGFGLLVKESLEVNAQFEVARISLGEILALTTELRDKQGQVVTGVRSTNANLAEAEKLYGKIREEAKRTTLTTQELTEATQQGLGFALRGGATVNQAVPLIAQVANLAKSLGARGQREIGAEVREVLTGNRLSQSRIGRTLGLSADDIKQARAAGNLVQFLNEKLAAGQPFLDRYKHSFEGVTSTLKSQGLEALRVIGKQTFDQLVVSLNILSAEFDKTFSPGKTQQFGNQLAQFTKQFFDEINGFVREGGLEKIKQGFIDLVQSVRDLVALIRQLHVPEIFLYLVQHARVILDVVLAFKGLQLASAGRAFLQNQNAPGALFAGTRAGVASAAAGNFEFKKLFDTIKTGVFGAFLTAIKTGIVAAAPLIAAALATVGITEVSKQVRKEAESAARADRERFASLRKRPFLSRVDAFREGLAGNAENGEQGNTSQLGLLGLRAAAQTPQQRIAAAIQATESFKRGGGGVSPLAIRGLLEGRGLETGGLGTRGARGALDAFTRQNVIGQVFSAPKSKADFLATLGPEELERRTKAADESESERKKRQSKGLFFLRETAKLEKDDAELKLREQAKLEEQAIRDHVLGKQREASLIRKVEENLTRDLRDLREKERTDTAKQIAELTGDRIGAIQAEFRERLLVIEQSDKKEADQARLRSAANLQRSRQLRDVRFEQRVAGLGFAASTGNNELLQIGLRNAQEFNDRLRQIETNAALTGAQKVQQIEAARSAARKKSEQEAGDLIRKNSFEALDLVRQIADAEQQRFRQRRDLELQARRLSRDAAREARDFAKQQLEAQNTLKRALEDEVTSRKRIGTLARKTGNAYDRNERTEPGTLGIEGTKLALQKEARQFLAATGIEAQLRSQLSAKNGRVLGSALATQKVREYGDRLAGGDFEGVQEELGQQGIRLSPRAQQIAASGVMNANAEANLGDTENVQSLQRQREDQGNPVRDARDRLKDLNDQISDAVENYKNATADLRDNFTKSVNDAATAVRDFGNTALEVLRKFAANGRKLPEGTRTAITGATAGLTQLPQAPGTPNEVERNFHFAPGAIVFNGVKSEDFRKVISDIIEQDRRVAGSGVR